MTTEPSKKLTQVERSEITRARLCEATLDALIENGYGKFSTADVAQRANVSRGALTHQFPTRDELIVAAFEHLHTTWESSWPFSDVENLPDLCLGELIDVLWEKLFHTGRYIASLEMMLAARINDNLGTEIRLSLQRWASKRDTIIARIIGMPVDDQKTRVFIQLNLCVMRGIAVHRSFDSDVHMHEMLLEEWKHIILSFRKGMQEIDGASVDCISKVSSG